MSRGLKSPALQIRNRGAETQGLASCSSTEDPSSRALSSKPLGKKLVYLFIVVDVLMEGNPGL